LYLYKDYKQINLPAAKKFIMQKFSPDIIRRAVIDKNFDPTGLDPT